MTIDVDEFVYKLPGSVGSGKPGAHRSHSRGAGLSFAAHARLFDQPDPRRIDLHASLSAVPRDWLVRTTYQRSSIIINAIVDVSASMHCDPLRGKLRLAAEFLGALGFSAFRAGDAVNLMAFDQGFREDLYLPPRWGRGVGAAMANRIASCEIRDTPGSAMRGLADCVERIAGRRGGLLFLVSDFHWSLDGLAELLESLHDHLVVPIVVWQQSEITPPEQDGLLSLRDAESGAMRYLWLRRKTRQDWHDNLQRRRREIDRVFAGRHIFPFHVDGDFDAEGLSHYFMERVA